MITVLTGASGTGKSTIEKELITHYGFRKIIPYTTRTPRKGEINGKDYYFKSSNDFNDMLKLDLFAEHATYSQDRMYGTLKADYINNSNCIVVLTPDGLRQLYKTMGKSNILSVLVQSSLGTKIKRCIDRIGVDKFNYDDKNEIAARMERDFGMFLGVEQEVDLVIQNEDHTSIKDLVNDIVNV